jgi:hypothetical protein
MIPVVAALLPCFSILPLRSRKLGSGQNEKTRTVACAGFLLCSAEREGFEPPVPLGTTVFKTAAFDHSAISPTGRKSNKLFECGNQDIIKILPE